MKNQIGDRLHQIVTDLYAQCSTDFLRQEQREREAERQRREEKRRLQHLKTFACSVRENDLGFNFYMIKDMA